MSELTERLQRHAVHCCYDNGETCREAADRIEQLETALRPFLALYTTAATSVTAKDVLRARALLWERR